MPQTIPPKNAENGGDPRTALSLLYAAKFGHLGIVLPFLAPWLQMRGFGPVAIGALLALTPLFKILAPWMWGSWADSSGRRRELLAFSAFSAAAALAAMVRMEGYVSLTLLMVLYGFARAPILPYVEATTLEQSERLEFAYGPIRLWGSLSFIVFSTGIGALQGWLSLDTALVVGATLLALCALLSIWVPAPHVQTDGSRSKRESSSAGMGDARRFGPVRFLAACALMQVSHGAYYTFYSIRLQELGYGGMAIGLLWAFAVLCEVLILTRMDGLVKRLGTEVVLYTSLAVAAGRWLLIGSVSGLAWLTFGQALHALTYAAFHVAAIQVVYRMFSGGQQARGQAMYSGMTFGLGLFVGSLGAGWLAELIGLPAVFKASAGVALVAIIVLGRSARR
jgi:PPP family 3-phenylpropionic acid transporter